MARGYSLAQILELKKQLEQQRMQILANAELARQGQERVIEALVDVFEEHIECEVAPLFLEQRSSYLECIRRDIKSARCHHDVLLGEREEARLRLVAAALERRKFELHRDSFDAAMRYELQCKEQAHSDDVGAQIYLRQRTANR